MCFAAVIRRSCLGENRSSGERWLNRRSKTLVLEWYNLKTVSHRNGKVVRIILTTYRADLILTKSFVQNAEGLAENISRAVVAGPEVVHLSVTSLLAGGHLLLNVFRDPERRCWPVP